MVTDVDYFFEWAVANRLNKVEWLLLGSYKWGDNPARVRRLKTLTRIGHQYSLLIGQCTVLHTHGTPIFCRRQKVLHHLSPYL